MGRLITRYTFVSDEDHFREGAEAIAFGGVAIFCLAAAQLPGLGLLAGVAVAPIALGYKRLSDLRRIRMASLEDAEDRLEKALVAAELRHKEQIIRHSQRAAGEILAPFDALRAAATRKGANLDPELDLFHQCLTSAVAIAAGRAGAPSKMTPVFIRDHLQRAVETWVPAFEARESDLTLDLSVKLPDGLFVDTASLDTVLDHMFHAALARCDDSEVHLHATWGGSGLVLVLGDDSNGLAKDADASCQRTQAAIRLACAIKGEGRLSGSHRQGHELRINLPAKIFHVTGLTQPYDTEIYLRPGVDLLDRESFLESEDFDLAAELEAFRQTRGEQEERRRIERALAKASKNLGAHSGARRTTSRKPDGAFPKPVDLQAAPDASGALSPQPLPPQTLPPRSVPPRLTDPTSERAESGRSGPHADMRILLVDDLVINQALFEAQARALGAHVTCTGTAEASLQALDTQSFDVVFMDVHMPGMGGVAGIRHIRERGLALPVVAYTADALPQTHADAVEAGADLILTKPVSDADLAETLRYCAARKHAHKPAHKAAHEAATKASRVA